MTLSNNPNTYKDVYACFEQVIKHNGGKLTFPTVKQAVKFRARCYKYRRLLTDQMQKRLPDGDLATTPYDDIVISKKDGSPVLEFSLVSALPIAFLTPSGEEVSMELPEDAPAPRTALPPLPQEDDEPPATDDLAEAAAAFAARIGAKSE